MYEVLSCHSAILIVLKEFKLFNNNKNQIKYQTARSYSQLLHILRSWKMQKGLGNYISQELKEKEVFSTNIFLEGSYCQRILAPLTFPDIAYVK